MPPLPRPVIAAWSAAVVVAFVPTWWMWEGWLMSDALRPLVEGVDLSGWGPEPIFEERYYVVTYGVVRTFDSFNPTPVLSPLVNDLCVVSNVAYGCALPAVLVLAGFLGCLRQGDPEAVARRVAWGLVVAAAVPTLAQDFALTILSPQWFVAMAGDWGRDQVCYLLAAALVLVASLHMPHRPGATSDGFGLRAAALLADYVIFCMALGLVMPLLYENHDFLDFAGFRGLLSHVEAGTLPVGTDLAVVALMFLYVWIPRGTTVGKRLVGLRVEGATPGKAALRALLFPVAVLWPEYGVLWLTADALWSFVDRNGQLLHDRLLGTSVRSPS